ncbi:eukaryotic and archaeal DNA primase, large subunit-domain-containing protein [Suillus paluster]|uniref:eukaryotic and archaeal DNA primase, large subunit-domain-containing protein n=1 Tax=Suillus paluster TaxID=48578 RepID=UPI001B868897|nr:eukaryotic and archaeal DNA primase, large subunit-domain-containing protein [Suillus paluster]KAG1756504.1 eukaryotic and archaeal DNA primase, large subunit-domain-containing protein [Suillus paluster]
MFNNHERKKFDPAKSAKSENEKEWPFRLNFYDKSPWYEVSLEDFERHALDRLRVLAEIESSFARNRSWEELKNVTTRQCKDYIPLNSTSASTVDTQTERMHDHLGHFVLRLAFCRSEDLRRRFVKAETALFRVRYENDDTRERELFLRSRDFQWTEVNSDEKQRYASELKALGVSVEEGVPTEKLYKVRWTQVPDLVNKRRVLLKDGWAYVPTKEQLSIILRAFEASLENALDSTARSIMRMDNDTRLTEILNHMSRGFVAGVASEYSGPATGDDITADMVDDLAKRHFPLCMRNLHECLMRDRHLKHFGRLQYGLFLKVLGLSIDEAIAFWRKSFSNITDDKFNKEYKYNIRHSFGLEGKRANYPAKSCQQILLADKPGPSDCHGCPYRHFAPDNLQTSLLATYSSQGLTSADLAEVMRTVKEGHYHVACTRVFEITHAAAGIKKGDGIGGGESVTHPNQYAAKSIEIEKAQQVDAMAVE